MACGLCFGRCVLVSQIELVFCLVDCHLKEKKWHSIFLWKTDDTSVYLNLHPCGNNVLPFKVDLSLLDRNFGVDWLLHSSLVDELQTTFLHEFVLVILSSCCFCCCFGTRLKNFGSSVFCNTWVSPHEVLRSYIDFSFLFCTKVLLGLPKDACAAGNWIEGLVSRCFSGTRLNVFALSVSCKTWVSNFLTGQHS